MSTSSPESTGSSDRSAAPPNHHADHGGFSGVTGMMAAIGFLSGRDEAAELAIELATLETGDRLVDVGCGPGVAVARARAQGAEAIGVDPASVMLRVARVRWWRDRGVDWRVGTAEAVPVDDDWATVLWSLATVHHWVDLDAGLAEVQRVLAPGGRFVAIERRIDDPYADGVASHGWTPDQAEGFARRCRDLGFVDVATASHDGKPDTVSVVAHRT